MHVCWSLHNLLSLVAFRRIMLLKRQRITTRAICLICTRTGITCTNQHNRASLCLKRVFCHSTRSIQRWENRWGQILMVSNHHKSNSSSSNNIPMERAMVAQARCRWPKGLHHNRATTLPLLSVRIVYRQLMRNQEERKRNYSIAKRRNEQPAHQQRPQMSKFIISSQRSLSNDQRSEVNAMSNITLSRFANSSV